MAPQKIKKAHKQLLSAIIPSLINDLYREGILSDKDLDDNTLLRKKLEDYLDKKELNLQIVIDHRETILNAAEREFKAGNSDFSIALFATFIEHTLNRLIHIECERKEIDKKTSTEIIKSVSMIGKCTWLLKILGLPPLRSEYLKTIIKIAEERNSYIRLLA